MRSRGAGGLPGRWRHDTLHGSASRDAGLRAAARVKQAIEVVLLYDLL